MQSFPDWPQLLPQADAPLPIGDDPDFRWTQPSRVRACFFRLDDIVPALAAREQAGAPLAVHVDVLRIDAALCFALTALTLHARRIEVRAGASLTLCSPDAAAPGCSLDIHADEWAFEHADECLPVTIGGVGHALHAQPPGGGLQARVDDDGSVDLLETEAPAPGDPLSGQIALNAARRLVYCPHLDEPGDTSWTRALPRKMADWVARTSDDPLLRADARAFAARVGTQRADVHVVPVLRLATYDRLAKDTQTALKAVEDEYREQLNRERSLADQKKSALRMLDHYRNAKAYADRLLAQAAEEMAAASEATELAQRRVDERRSEVETSQAAFEAGIQARKKQLEREAVFAIFTGILELGVGIAAVVATGGAAAPVAAAAGAKAVKAGTDAATKIQKLIELLKKIKKVLEVIAKIAAFYAKLKSAFDAIGQPALARKRVELASQAMPDPLDPEDQMNEADWDEFMVGLDVLFKPAVDERIDGADDFLLAMKRLAVRGKALVTTQAALDRAQQRFQQGLWQTLRDEADIADMAARIEALGKERGPGSVLMTYTAQVRDRLAFRLLHAIETMADAYRYETLREPRARPNVTHSGAQLAKTLSDLQQDLVSAKEARSAQGEWTDSLSVTAPGALASLKATRSLSWVVGPKNFEDFDRVRLKELRVWLRGELGPARRVIDLTTSGHYLDRLGGETFEFSTRALQRSFSYEPDVHGGAADRWGEPVRVIYRANDAEGDYFQPTAFTTWTLSLPDKGDDGPDLSQLTELVLEFVGTAARAGRSVRASPNRLGVATRGKARPKKLLTQVVIL